MSHTETRNPLDRNRGRAAVSLGWLASAAFLFGVTGGGLPEARGQQALRRKFQSGDVLKYTTEQSTVMTVKITGRERKQKRAISTTYSWSIKAVGDNGDADITQKIERLKMKIEAPPYLPMEFDSNSPNSEVLEPFETVVKQLKAAVGAEFSFQMKPTGEIHDIKITEGTLKKLREGLEQGERDTFSEQALKDQVSQTSPPPLPKDPIEPGKTWSAPPNRIPAPMGTLVLDRSFTFQGPDSKNPNLMYITMDGHVTLEPAPNMPAKIRAQEGKGSVTFDVQAGRLQSSKGTQKTEMVITDEGQERDEITETNSTMTLVP
jgi:hypothetical protein